MAIPVDAVETWDTLVQRAAWGRSTNLVCVEFGERAVKFTVGPVPLRDNPNGVITGHAGAFADQTSPPRDAVLAEVRFRPATPQSSYTARWSAGPVRGSCFRAVGDSSSSRP